MEIKFITLFCAVVVAAAASSKLKYLLFVGESQLGKHHNLYKQASRQARVACMP